MKNLILNRIELIKNNSENFSPKFMRWKNAFYGMKQFSEIDFNELKDEELLDIFELILYKYFKQM
jgi:hypothetical protein